MDNVGDGIVLFVNCGQNGNDGIFFREKVICIKRDEEKRNGLGDKVSSRVGEHLIEKFMLEDNDYTV